MNIHDWRSVPGATFARLYEAEALRWSLGLHWNTRANWVEVEAARAAGRLAGLVARDAAGEICGWTFYLLHHGALEIGALAATSPAVTTALIDGALASPEADRASSVMVFVYSDGPALIPHLRTLGFAVERYLYLSADLAHAPLDPPGRPFENYDHAVHAAGVEALLATAYPAHDPVRPFVRHNQPHEWAEYVGQLVNAGGCGTFLPGFSFVAGDPESARLAGATMVTRLAADTVHLAQIAVSPQAQGHGLARRLLGTSLLAARAHGFARATLLVAEGNTRARQLYGRLGFTAAAAFVSAGSDQPRRSSSVALDTGGAITLR